MMRDCQIINLMVNTKEQFFSDKFQQIIRDQMNKENVSFIFMLVNLIITLSIDS